MQKRYRMDASFEFDNSIPGFDGIFEEELSFWESISAASWKTPGEHYQNMPRLTRKIVESVVASDERLREELRNVCYPALEKEGMFKLEKVEPQLIDVIQRKRLYAGRVFAADGTLARYETLSMVGAQIAVARVGYQGSTGQYATERIQQRSRREMIEQEKTFARASQFSSIENTDELVAELEAEFVESDVESARRSKLTEGAIAFVHFDPTTAQSNVVDALVHYEDLQCIDRGLYVLIHSLQDDRYYSGRIIQGPFYDPDALKRDTTPVQFIILNQGAGKVLSLPEYHGRVAIEILGEERDGTRFGAMRRPDPGSPVKLSEVNCQQV